MQAEFSKTDVGCTIYSSCGPTCGRCKNASGFFRSVSIWEDSSSTCLSRIAISRPCFSDPADIIRNTSTVVRMHESGVRMSCTDFATTCFQGNSSPSLCSKSFKQIILQQHRCYSSEISDKRNYRFLRGFNKFLVIRLLGTVDEPIHVEKSIFRKSLPPPCQASTGIQELDEITGGRIPSGRPTLVSGSGRCRGWRTCSPSH